MNKIGLDIKLVVPGVFSIKVVENSITRGLRASDYAPFSEDMEFAGISSRGKPLSVPKSKGPAYISGFLLKASSPGDDWVPIERFSQGVLIMTAKPDVQVCLGAGDWRGTSPEVFIPRSVLLDRYSLFHHYGAGGAQQLPHDVIIDVREPGHGVYFLRTFPKCQFFQSFQTSGLVLPPETWVNAHDWVKLDRHVYTGETSAPYKHTVPVGNATGVFLPGKTQQEVLQTYGILGVPVGFKDGALGFLRLRILDPAKANRAHPALGKFGGKVLEIGFPGYGQASVRMEEFVKNPRLIEASWKVVVDSGLNGVVADQSAITTALLDYPLFNRDEREHPNEVICPKHLVDQFFSPVREVSRTHKIEDVVRYTIKSEINTTEPGKWLLTTDIAKLKPRDRKQEFQSRKARRIVLESAYGKLPEGWEKLDDEQLKLYFSIRQRHDAGEIIPYNESPFRAYEWDHDHKMIHWLKEHKQIATCPVSAKVYVPNYTSIDEMASIPGFWQMIENMFGEKDLLRALLMSQKAQSMAMTELI